ncbi:hypothetical protein SAMN05421505_11459 [Sinosporangium album]|uniref:Cupin domain-containing protein n=1 Tax=Sinosporangium album TaxID=504805 RepID=A0A1G8BIP0_9ACTN|nr:hypothetical protein [Sinosporangium album]SDH33097.1 hypothetical protein SAMN05421505_11459 [Sinosporangium album]
MPSIRIDDASRFSRGTYSCVSASWEGVTVSFEETLEDSDATERFRRALGEHGCMCPHWGYQITGTSTYYFADREPEVYGPGELFYLPPGHAPTHSAGSTWISISPTAVHEAVQAITRTTT